mmetsp:Transcript_15851/g.36042  ORF Transcript_15851/g.36042 Transcript_15851/m.36042 type:complete len:250 (+) Transcript_15851:104-853(+)
MRGLVPRLVRRRLPPLRRREGGGTGHGAMRFRRFHCVRRIDRGEGGAVRHPPLRQVHARGRPCRRGGGRPLGHLRRRALHHFHICRAERPGDGRAVAWHVGTGGWVWGDRRRGRRRALAQGAWLHQVLRGRQVRRCLRRSWRRASPRGEVHHARLQGLPRQLRVGHGRPCVLVRGRRLDPLLPRLLQGEVLGPRGGRVECGAHSFRFLLRQVEPRDRRADEHVRGGPRRLPHGEDARQDQALRVLGGGR